MKTTTTLDDNALAARVAILESQLGLSAAAQAAAAVAELEAEIQERQTEQRALYEDAQRHRAIVESHRLAVLEAQKAHRVAARDAGHARNRWQMFVEETRRLQAELDAMKAQQAGRIEAQRAPVVRSLPHAPRPN